MSYRGEQKIKDKIYIYEAVAIWNPEKKRSEQKRIYIGRKDPDTGAFIPNKKYAAIEAAKQAGQSADEAIMAMFSGKPGGSGRGHARTSSSGQEPSGNAAAGGSTAAQAGQAASERPAAGKKTEEASAAPVPVSAREYGRTSALRQLAKSCGLIHTLQRTLPGTGKKLLDRVITGSDSLPAIDELSASRFFQEWIDYCGDVQYLALYAGLQEYFPKPEPAAGKSRISAFPAVSAEMPQLMVLYGADSELPVFFRCEERTQPTIPDLITGFAFLRPLDLLQVRFCFQEDIYTDRGLYLLLQHGFRFTARIPMSAAPAASLLRGFDPEDHSDEITVDIGGAHYVIHSRRTMVNGRDAYCHICCDTRRRQLLQSRLLHHICSLEEGVSNGSLQMTDASVRHYLSFDRRTGEGYLCSRKADVIRDELRYAGCFILLSNAEANPIRALKSCLDQKDITQTFGRLQASAAADPVPFDVQGPDPWPQKDALPEVFCSFLALILQAYLRRRLQHAIAEGRLDSSCTPDSILDELSEIRRILWSDGSHTVTRLTQRQEAICEAVGIQIV